MLSEHVKMQEKVAKSASNVVCTAWMSDFSSLSMSYVFYSMQRYLDRLRLKEMIQHVVKRVVVEIL